MSIASTPVPAASVHAVQFYDDHDFLASIVADFLGTGLASGAPCVVIATAEHRRSFARQLLLAGFNVDALVGAGRLLMFDAQEALRGFMVDGRPDPARFDEVVGSRVRGAVEAAGGAATVRAYGEMVDLLWRDGRRTSAVELEELWNALAARHRFSLLCAYNMNGFLQGAGDVSLADVCRCHQHIAPPDLLDTTVSETDRQIALVHLQQRTAALETEVAHRKVLEAALREMLHEQRAADVRLRDREQELTDFLENAAEGLHWVGPDGRVIWANEAELQLVGRTADEYVGHHLSEFHADPMALEALLERLARNETVRNYPAQLRHRDGSVRHVLINSNVYWRDGVFVHTRCFTRDVTALRQTQAQLEEAIRVREDFISVASHELRNPVHVIQLQVLGLQEAAERPEPLPRDWAIGKLGRLGSQIARLGRLLDNLLDVSRMTAGRLHLELEALDAAAVVSEVAERHREQLGGLTLALQPCPGQWDRLRLDQVVSNLMSNAVKFGEHRPVDVRLESTDTSVVLQVTDQGVGISAAGQEHLFSRFERASANRSFGGFGLGLWITREIVAAMGGTIGVDSEPGRGARFTVNLPRVPGPAV